MSQKYVPPHRRKQPTGHSDRHSDGPRPSRRVGRNGDEKRWATAAAIGNFDDAFVDAALSRVRCINLRRRMDKWESIQRLARGVDGRFARRMVRFDAVDGDSGANPTSVDDDDVRREWDATNNHRYVNPTKEKPMGFPHLVMSPGEVGCAMSHVALWRELVSTVPTSFPRDSKTSVTSESNAMLILEDDCSFVRCRRTGRDRFAVAFQRAWNALPSDWGIFYLGFSDRGERTWVDTSDAEKRGFAPRRRRGTDPMDFQVRLYRPEYGYHTHAYMITRSGAERLLQNLPVCGPIDVWLADNNWFGLHVYCGVIAGEGWRLDDGTYEGTQLVWQLRGDKGFVSDIQQSAHGA